MRALADRLRTGITELGYDLALPPDGAGHSGLVCFTGRRTEGAELVRRLASAGIHVSVPDGLVRVSPHFWTTDEEVAEILEELALHKS